MKILIVRLNCSIFVELSIEWFNDVIFNKRNSLIHYSCRKLVASRSKILRSKSKLIPVSTCQNDIKFFLEISLAFKANWQQYGAQLEHNLPSIQELFHSFYEWMWFFCFKFNAIESKWHWIFFPSCVKKNYNLNAAQRKERKYRQKKRWHVLWMNERR